MMWTAETEAALRADYGVIPHREIAKAYGIGHSSITKKAKELGLTSLLRYGVAFTPEQDAILTALWGGTKCAAEIGEDLGRTKNAIIGRARRLGLERLSRAPKLQRERVRKPPRIDGEHKERKAPVKVFVSPPVPVVPLNILFGDLQHHHCREVVGQDAWESLSCGHQRTENSSYCRWHHAVNYTTPVARARPYYRVAA